MDWSETAEHQKQFGLNEPVECQRVPGFMRDAM